MSAATTLRPIDVDHSGILPPQLGEQEQTHDQNKREGVAEGAVVDRVVEQVRTERDRHERRQDDSLAEVAEQQPPQ